MRQLFQRWLGTPRPEAWALSDYPPFPLPHPGCGKALSLAQAQENLARFEASLGPRQQALRQWLLAHDGPDAQALPGAAYATALKAWARTHWARLPAFARLPAHAPWPDCPRDGAFIVYSLLGDLAASLGEAIRRANPDWHWGLNLDAIDLADGMATSRRVVLLADLAEPTPETREAVLDLEPLLFGAHRFPESVDFVHLDTWTRTVQDAIDGAYHRPR
ncbi:MAG: hypothetical protein JNL93_11915 [Pelomonas sp.]|nr:hypothetical protein [Roseateles sp.]